ncbi:hypothetical protein [Nonomuraea sp. NPDC050691]|uniref:hypothetical protein n=1 Tax=Nonomuraea sp. NPDC050691 TaxID=3155661 RepID=UPI0033D7A1BD
MSRYNQREPLNKQELAAAREREQIARDRQKYGHDEQAARRAVLVDGARRTIADVLPAFPAELQEQGRRQLEQEIAEVHASGPVGCTYAYWRCVESRPSLDEPQ